ncbi:hypothetical protein [Mesorhizobium sp. NBSH29]|uniref:hypothetical protein n=1 Tax=Mesorhizobium sp. NBSH29 TaxID=2654249 RepID=UPI0018968582|nr:hypothetical protein [Mesorhizobium sp. NBSH29]
MTVIKVAQSAGIPLAEISDALAQLSRNAILLTRRIALLTTLHGKTALGIGCGYLSVKRCPLVNEDDHLAEGGPGARLLQEVEDCHSCHGCDETGPPTRLEKFASLARLADQLT